jgi:hypothetical protein
MTIRAVHDYKAGGKILDLTAARSPCFTADEFTSVPVLLARQADPPGGKSSGLLGCYRQRLLLRE